MRRKSIIVPVCLAWLLQVSTLLAADVDMQPGKWEFVQTTHMPMLEQPEVTTETECVSEADLKDPLAQIVEESNCRILEKKGDSSGLSFVMECVEEGVSMRGEGHFSFRGATASDKMEMHMDTSGMPVLPNMQGMPELPMTMTAVWEGRRLGKCQQ